MAMWIPTNKVTKTSYPPITEEQKAAWLADPMIGPKYRFEQIKETAVKAPVPHEAKRVDVPGKSEDKD